MVVVDQVVNWTIFEDLRAVEGDQKQLTDLLSRGHTSEQRLSRVDFLCVACRYWQTQETKNDKSAKQNSRDFCYHAAPIISRAWAGSLHMIMSTPNSFILSKSSSLSTVQTFTSLF